MPQVEVGVEVTPQSGKGKLVLDFKVPDATKLKVCVDYVIPDWHWSKLKHEKWVLHRWPDGYLEQRKLGER